LGQPDSEYQLLAVSTIGIEILMNKLRLFVIYLASSLLLTGCDLPTNLETIVGWRDKFVINLTPDQLQNYVGDILMLVVTLVLVRALIGITQDLESETSILRGHGITALVIIISVAMIYLLIPVANLITQLVLPSDVTIDSVLENLHLSISINPIKMITGVWAISISVLLPVLVTYCLLGDLVLAICVLMFSAIWLNTKIFWVIISVWAGHALFICLFFLIQNVMGSLYPSWQFADISSASSSFYIGLVLILMAICYFVVPLTGLIFGPELFGVRSVAQTEGKNGSKAQPRKIDLDEIIPIIIPIQHTDIENRPVENGGEEPDLGSPDNSGGPDNQPFTQGLDPETEPIKNGEGYNDEIPLVSEKKNKTDQTLKTYTPEIPGDNIPKVIVPEINDAPIPTTKSTKTEKTVKLEKTVSTVKKVIKVVATVPNRPEVRIGNTVVKGPGNATLLALEKSEQRAKKEKQNDEIPGLPIVRKDEHK
jgi:hypothetical protein